MSFDSVIGQKKARNCRNHSSGMGRCLMLICSAGRQALGTESALALAKALFCIQKQDDGCGSCDECTKIESGNHPFFYSVKPDGQSIKVDNSESCRAVFLIKAMRGKQL